VARELVVQRPIEGSTSFAGASTAHTNPRRIPCGGSPSRIAATVQAAVRLLRLSLAVVMGLSVLPTLYFGWLVFQGTFVNTEHGDFPLWFHPLWGVAWLLLAAFSSVGDLAAH
jgi:hypothetical protein